MDYLIGNIVAPFQEEIDPIRVCAGKLNCSVSMIQHVELYRKSIDARKKDRIKFVYSFVATLDKPLRYLPDGVRAYSSPELDVQIGDKKITKCPVIVGFGPAGMFAGLILSRYGYRPIILEKGQDVDQRTLDVELFSSSGILNPCSNVQFGEGGAGTFSDGKLMTRINHPACRFVLNEFVKHGAPGSILYQAKPHVGTDLLKGIVKSIREEIIANGGEVHFGTEVTGLSCEDNQIVSLETTGGLVDTEAIFLCVGNAARNIFKNCFKNGIPISSKPFSVGVRIEQNRQTIDESLFGKYAGNALLGGGEYQLSYRNEAEEKAVYTFCMCPGGVVIPSSSEHGAIVTNGMSYHARSGPNSNAALVVSVNSDDYGCGPLDGIAFQEQIEKAAFNERLPYFAPVQTVKDFLSGKCSSSFGIIKPTYQIGYDYRNISTLFSNKINDYLKTGLLKFNRQLPGFSDPDCILTAPETRTSSPVKMDRSENRISIGWTNLYPCGEGSGYAGGITSSAVDGIESAIAYMKEFKP